MPTPAYMTIQGSRQGLITAGAFTAESVGNSYQEGHEDQILVQALKHGVATAYENRQHKPLIVTKVIDKSSPLINIALTTGEPLTRCCVKFYRLRDEGVQEHFYTLELIDAVIIQADILLPHCQDPRNAEYTLLETVHFAYRKIIWTHEACGTTGEDLWRA